MDNFRNEQGQKISYDCSELIYELEQDIAEYGSDLMVDVITQMHLGVKIYKDYMFTDTNDLKLNADESLERIKATDLIELYREENKII
jgi:hypothetical protein